jgi:hypothetical protein
MNEWDENFAGKCVSCVHANPTQYKHTMECRNKKAVCRGLPSAGAGGGEYKMQVYKLFGCIYWQNYRKDT